MVWTAMPPMRFPAATSQVTLQDRGNGDGYLGQATRDGQQDDPAERFAEVQTVIEGVRGPGKGRTGEPGGHPADEEQSR